MSTLAADSLVLPLTEQQLTTVGAAVAGLSPAQLQWVSGYVAGLAASERAEPAAAVGRPFTILYGSQTGNGEAVAEALASRARESGFNVNLTSLADYKPANLKRESVVSIVVSTHGEGDPPDDAELFHEFLMAAKAPKLSGLKYTVLALGDSSYANFCQTGREFDERLAALGAERLTPLVECDLDFDAAAGQWSDAVLEELPAILEAGAAVPTLRAVDSVARFDKHNPFPAEVLLNQKITAMESTKDVRHIELSLEGSGLDYEPGDALAVVAVNPPQLVDELILELGANQDAIVEVDGAETPLADALASRLEITAANQGFLREWSAVAQSSDLATLLEDGQQRALAELLESHQVIDIVRRYPADVSPQVFVNMLRKLAPRSYSIASSHRANPDEVHLTVAAVRYDAFGFEHWGAASTHLADRLSPGDTVAVFVEKNSRFRLPENDDVPIIMIGPGTGVAPFRAFVEERAERDARGKSWLFFGDRTFSSDFLYQLEWQRHLKHGRLSRLDVAFSRDQEAKVYVQDRLRENAAEVYRWIEQGAVIYVCGDAKHMAGDVNDALIDVLSSQAGLDADAAAAMLKELRRAGRYQRDVY